MFVEFQYSAKKFLLKEKKKPAKNADTEEELGDLKKAPLSEEFVEDSDSDYGEKNINLLMLTVITMAG